MVLKTFCLLIQTISSWTTLRLAVYYRLSTWMACTSLLLSSKAADAVEVPKDAAPLWRPLMMRPSFLYCSIGSQKRSLTPWTGGRRRVGENRSTNNLIINLKTVNCWVCRRDWGRNSHSWTTECMGPTPPKMPGSWFFLMSFSHSVTAYWITLSTPSRLKSRAQQIHQTKPLKY